MTEAICHECIEDAYLKQEVLEGGTPYLCSECGETKIAITVEDLGKRLEPLLRQSYVPGEYYRVFGGEDDDRGYDEQHGDDLSDIVQEVLGQYFKAHDAIIAAINDADEYWPPDGGEAYWEDFTNYVFKGAFIDPTALPDWHGTEADLKHGMRFFSIRAGQLFKGIFSNIESVNSYESGSVLPVVEVVPAQTRIFRARMVGSKSTLTKVNENPALEVGPPPSASARAGRMNPDGVAVLYAAMDVDTCIAEMRPAIGSDVAIISLLTTRPLRILDFKRLEGALSGFSMFDPDYNLKRQLHHFLRRLHYLISRPVVPGKEFDYLITQAMAEYLSCVHSEPFDGVRFGSAQRQGGVNIVLLPGARAGGDSVEEQFGAVYEEGSLKFARISAVQVSHSEMNVNVTADGGVGLESTQEYYDLYEDD